MKTNLQTFPKKFDRVYIPAEIEKWKLDFEEELRDYIDFIDRAKRTHPLSIEMKIRYEIYKELLKE